MPTAYCSFNKHRGPSQRPLPGFRSPEPRGRASHLAAPVGGSSHRVSESDACGSSNQGIELWVPKQRLQVAVGTRHHPHAPVVCTQPRIYNKCGDRMMHACDFTLLIDPVPFHPSRALVRVAPISQTACTWGLRYRDAIVCDLRQMPGCDLWHKLDSLVVQFLILGALCRSVSVDKPILLG